jgi:hypothetical protein
LNEVKCTPFILIKIVVVVVGKQIGSSAICTMQVSLIPPIFGIYRFRYCSPG